MAHGPLSDTAGASTANATESRGTAAVAFVSRQKMGLRDILDGTANTIMCGEITTDLGDNDIRTRAADGTLLMAPTRKTQVPVVALEPLSTQRDHGSGSLRRPSRRGHSWASLPQSIAS